MAQQNIADVTTTPPAASAGCGCGTPAETVSSSTAAVATCCGSKDAAEAAGAYCVPAAKKDAVAAGARCCG